MNPSVKDLIHAVVSQVVEKGGYVTKTKLLKLLYLFDVEYYRIHRRTCTGFNWKFFHLGPWAREFDLLLEELVRKDMLVESTSTKQEYDTKFYRAAEPRDTTSLFSAFADEAILRSLLNIWSEANTGEILDYVYFRTEPMEHGIRNEPLDFSRIGQDKPEKYERQASGVQPKEIRERRRQFEQKMAQQAAAPRSFQFTPPRYDDEFQKALAKLEAANL